MAQVFNSLVYKWLSSLFDPRSFHVRFVVGNVALCQVFQTVLRVSPVSIFPPMLHIHVHQKDQQAKPRKSETNDYSDMVGALEKNVFENCFSMSTWRLL